MAIITANAGTPVPRSALDTRPQEARRARLSGATRSVAASNPCDLSIDPYSQVSDIQFDDDSTVTVVKFRRVTEDDLDW